MAQRKEAIRTNKLMNSAIRGEQMIALKNERAFQAQMAKVSAPIKSLPRKAAALPDLVKERQKYVQLLQRSKAVDMGAIVRPIAQALKTLQSPNNLIIVDQMYDRLFKVRQILSELPKAMITKDGPKTSATWLKYRQEELMLSQRINLFEAQRVRLQKEMVSTVSQVRNFENAPVARQAARVKEVASLHKTQRQLDAANVAKSTAARAKQAKTVQALDRTIAGRRVASEMKLATLRSRLTSVRGAGSMAGGLAKGAMSGIAGGFKSLKGMMTGANLLRAGQGIMTLAGGFLRLAGSVGRFVFSWNFVGMIFNVLLMFGDKIPAVVNAFKALGAGISGAFGELGKVASYAGPAMNLFKLAFSAFRQGETGVGVQALQTGFMGLVDIIKNQLVAAWNTFLVHVEYMWIVLRKIFEGLKVIFMSIFEGISKTFGFMASPIMASLGDVFGSGGGGNMGQTATMIVQGIDMFVTGFFKGLISLSETLQTFLADFQGVVGQIVSRIPGTGSAGARIQGDASETRKLAETRGSLARGMLEHERKQRAKQLEQIMAISPQEIARRRAGAAAGANERSAQTSYGMDVAYEKLLTTLDGNLAKRAADLNKLQQDVVGPMGPASGPSTVQQLQQELPKFLQALTGGAMSTRAILRTDTKRQEDLMKEGNALQQETNRLLSIQGGIG
jgi:hypothetical protein